MQSRIAFIVSCGLTRTFADQDGREEQPGQHGLGSDSRHAPSRLKQMPLVLQRGYHKAVPFPGQEAHPPGSKPPLLEFSRLTDRKEPFAP
jgi:hypothetical protein